MPHLPHFPSFANSNDTCRRVQIVQLLIHSFLHPPSPHLNILLSSLFTYIQQPPLNLSFLDVSFYQIHHSISVTPEHNSNFIQAPASVISPYPFFFLRTRDENDESGFHCISVFIYFCISLPTMDKRARRNVVG
jgi:hypothetical protein